MNKLSNGMGIRGEIVARRTYCRPLNDSGTLFESWDDVCERVGNHQRWLWERALTSVKYPSMGLGDIKEGFKGWETLDNTQENEIRDLVKLFKTKKGLPSGRTLWLGGTDTAKKREASMFNCAHLRMETVYDVVDALWLLMQGCGVGVTPIVGTLTGFRSVISEIEVIQSTRTESGGLDYNEEWVENGVWCIKVGDSAEAWAKSVGKLMAGKHKVDKLILDFSEIRPSGERLKGYGWISSGSESIGEAFTAIAKLLNRKAGAILSKIDILDVGNWCGTILSSRRSAEIMLVEYGTAEWEEFADAKAGWYEVDAGGKMKNPQRVQSNNSLVFYKQPSRDELVSLFKRMEQNGGSEPAFINGSAAIERAPFFAGGNPCFEILLPNKGFCNLIELNLSEFRGDSSGMYKAMRLLARANYRQTVVDLRDGILQEAWHLNNEFLRLCGTGITGIAMRDDMSKYELKQLRNCAVMEAYIMAKELGTQRPANVTTVKPSGSISKVMGCTEGIHKPLGKYIFNWIKFSKSDPLCNALRSANYTEQEEPTDNTSTLFCLPISYDDVHFSVVVTDTGRAVEVNTESALTQLERYKKVQIAYCDQNVSNTISYSPDEVPDIIDWFVANWDIYVGVSFLYRTDPTMTAADLGYKYLPQEVKTKEEYESYVKILLEVNFDGTESFEELTEDECAGGVCPIK